MFDDDGVDAAEAGLAPAQPPRLDRVADAIETLRAPVPLQVTPPAVAPTADRVENRPSQPVANTPQEREAVDQPNLPVFRGRV